MSQTAYPGVNNLTEEKLQPRIKTALDPGSRHNLARLQPGAHAALPGGEAALIRNVAASLTIPERSTSVLR